MEKENENLGTGLNEDGTKKEEVVVAEFDPSKFTEEPVVKVKEEVKDEKVKTKEEDDDGEDSFEWANYDEEDVDDGGKKDEPNETPEAKETRIAAEKLALENKANENKGNDNKSSLTDDQFKAFATEIGLEVTSPKELKEAIIKLEEELDSYRNGVETKNVTNDKITRLSNLKAKTDEELLRLDLAQQKFTEEEIQESIDTYMDNGLLKIEAKKIRATIDKAINAEQENITKSKLETESMTQKQQEESVIALKEHIGKTETMFGLKMAKDAASLVKVQEGHFKYISSGKFLEEITKDSDSLSQVAWLWKNREVIMRAKANAGVQKGREEILNDIGNVDVANVNRFKGPKDSDGFDPKKFTYGT